jgi:phospholipid/cholesterol/gamma-HCH transport system substrate-binding protein
MENKSHAIAAGTFVLLLAALLIAMAVWLTRDTSSQRIYEISSKEGVTGLQPQAGVRYKGVQVGRVSAISLDPQTHGNVLVRIAVSDAAPVTASTFASLGFQGVTGLAFVQLDDSGDATQPLATSITHPGRIPMRPGLMSRITEQGGHLLKQLDEASQRIDALVAPENQKILMAAVSNLSQAAAGIGQLTRHADQVLTGSGPEGSASLPRMATQLDTSFKSIQLTAERLRDSAETVKNSAEKFRLTNVRINEPGGTLDKIARSTEALAASTATLNATLLPRLSRTTDDAARTVRQFGRVADGLAEQPQSLLWGRGPAAPGPGESGFVAPATAPADQ